MDRGTRCSTPIIEPFCFCGWWCAPPLSRHWLSTIIAVLPHQEVKTPSRLNKVPPNQIVFESWNHKKWQRRKGGNFATFFLKYTFFSQGTLLFHPPIDGPFNYLRPQGNREMITWVKMFRHEGWLIIGVGSLRPPWQSVPSRILMIIVWKYELSDSSTIAKICKESWRAITLI